MTTVEVHGAGPAGSSAAIAASLAGAEVDLYDPSPFPRHRVCGEFLSPEALPILESFGLADSFAALDPAHYSHLVLRIGARTIRSPLPHAAFGISRFVLDNLLLNRALSLGVRLHRERGPESSNRPTVIAHGRRTAQSPPRGQRLFGFKAHFNGLSAEPLTLFFSGRAYVGMNTVENGVTNVCGIAPESELQRHGFQVDAYLDSLPELRLQFHRLTRAMSWMTTGPLVYSQGFQTLNKYQYPAGDTLSFVDPFTGSGILTALITGQLAGNSAAHRITPTEYLQICRRTLRRPFLAASFFRAVLATPFAGALAQLVSPEWMVRATRPTIQSKSFKM